MDYNQLERQEVPKEYPGRLTSQELSTLVAQRDDPSLPNSTRIAARNTIADHNLPLVLFVIKRYRPPGDLQDLLSIGNLALIRAADFYDPKKGEFSTYAHTIIFRALLRNKEKKQPIPLSELSENEKNYLNGLVTQNPKDNHLDFKGPISQAIDLTLDDREADIIRSRYGIDREKEKLIDLGKRYNLTRERIRQIELKALKKLRNYFGIEEQNLPKNNGLSNKSSKKTSSPQQSPVKT